MDYLIQQIRWKSCFFILVKRITRVHVMPRLFYTAFIHYYVSNDKWIHYNYFCAFGIANYKIKIKAFVWLRNPFIKRLKYIIIEIFYSLKKTGYISFIHMITSAIHFHFCVVYMLKMLSMTSTVNYILHRP